MTSGKESLSKVHLRARLKRLTEKGEKIVELATAKGAFRDAVAALNACAQFCELDADLRMTSIRRPKKASEVPAKGTRQPAVTEDTGDLDVALAEHVAAITKGFQKEEIDALIERLRAIAQKTAANSSPNTGRRLN